MEHFFVEFDLNFFVFQFSIAAINDTDSKRQWEPLAPTKESQACLLLSLFVLNATRFRTIFYQLSTSLCTSDASSGNLFVKFQRFVCF